MTQLSLEVTRLQWLSERTFEIRFQRPQGFRFVPGQKVRFTYQDVYREYTLVSAPEDDTLAICVRHIEHGRFSPVLARSQKGDRFRASSPFGYFCYQPASVPAVFVATGTGVAPFVAFACSGVRGFYLLHGVRSPSELYYRSSLERAAANYIPCLSGAQMSNRSAPVLFQGRVTDYLASHLPEGIYDFYLCGRTEMVADTTRIIDEQFDGSKVFVETFF